MIRILIVSILLGCSIQALADEYVQGYVKKDGTYVAPHMRSNADGQTWNNYSAKGNTNPYTGKEGSESPYVTQPSYQPYRPYQPYQPYGAKR